MEVREWFAVRRRAVLGTTAALVVAGAAAVAIPAVADAGTVGACNVDVGNLKVCVFRDGDQVWAGVYANPTIYTKVEVKLDGMTVKCTNGACRDHAFTVFSAGPSSPSDGRLKTDPGNWEFGLSAYAVHHYLGFVKGTRANGSEETAQTGWQDATSW
ncbi:hypothetical protein ABZS66_45665 [Dactylosporangium sp. NPDC005572]|uniref:hypothetical protein n=1 Tax=Dactylosporangium sp. NPDC005572 TaxID=3156889 RepID=UPI00339EABD8